MLEQRYYDEENVGGVTDRQIDRREIPVDAQVCGIHLELFVCHLFTASI